MDLPRTIATGAPGVALTFDDGPHPEGTPAVLEVLARAGARATFFLVGEQVQRRPALAAEIVAAGHAVALHGYRHRPQLRLSAGEVRDDIGAAPQRSRTRRGSTPGCTARRTGSTAPPGCELARERRPAAAAVVALGQGLAQVHDPGADRRSGHRTNSARAT